MALTAPELYSRVRAMLPEMIRFGIVGGFGTVIDLGGAGLLEGAYHVEPLVAKAVSVSLAMITTYLGSRYWTFRERENQSVRREAVLFFVLNLFGLLIAEIVIALVTYGMGLHGRLAYNAASFVGTGSGTIFRFWAYRKWIFLEPEQPPAPAPQPDARASADCPPWELDPSFLAPLQAPARAQAQAPAPAPVTAPVHAAPWEQASAAAWDPADAPTISWGVPPSLAAPRQTLAFDRLAPDHPGATLPAPAAPAADYPVPAQDIRRPAPAPSRPPRSGGGRHRKS